MNLLSLRTALVDRTGRFDLVVDTTSYVDNGADFFINAGSRLLDRLYKHPKEVNKIFAEIAAGEWSVTFANCRAVKSVWAGDATERNILEKVGRDDLMISYNVPIASIDRGTPLYYCPAYIRSTDSTDADALATYADLVNANYHEYNSVILMPPADAAYVIEVQGLFYSDVLSINSDENYWSVVHPDVLIMAAMYKIEVFYRNTEGAKDWMSAIELEARTIDMDIVEEEITDVSQMEG